MAQQVNFYETERARVGAEIPRNLYDKKADALLAYMRDHFKMDIDPATGEQTPQNKATAMLSATAKAVFDPARWKNPIYAKFTEDARGYNAREWVKLAVIWYHGADPLESFVGVYSMGYACD